MLQYNLSKSNHRDEQFAGTNQRRTSQYVDQSEFNNMNRVPVGMKLTLNISRNIKPNSKRDQNVVISLFNTAAQTAKFIPSLL